MAAPENIHRPEMAAADRGGDISLGIEGEVAISSASLAQAIFWTDVYREIHTMEEKVMLRIEELMAVEPPTAQLELRRTNVPVIASQGERSRHRHDYCPTKGKQLQENLPPSRRRAKTPPSTP